MSMLRDIGVNMYYHRQRAGLTLRALADKAGVACSTISQIESGKNSGSLHTIACLAEALGISVTDYLSPPAPSARRARKELVTISMEAYRSACDSRPHETITRELAEAIGREVLARGLCQIKTDMLGVGELITAKVQVAKEAKPNDGEV